MHEFVGKKEIETFVRIFLRQTVISLFMKIMNKKLVKKLSILKFAKISSRISVELIKCIKHNPALYAKLRMNRKHFKSKITREK